MATERFSLLIDSRTTGTQEVARLEEQLRRVADLAEKSGSKATGAFKTQATELRSTLDSIKGSIQDPFSAMTQGAENFALKFGRVGVVAGGVVAGLTAAGVAMFSLVSSVDDAGEQLENMARRTGLSIGQVDKLQAMARIAGVNVDVLENSSRVLAETLSDTATGGQKARAAIEKLGVSIYDTSGSQREMGQITLDIIKALSGVENQSERVRLANLSLGKGGKELQPLIQQYVELESRVTKLGVGLDENLLAKVSETGDRMAELGIKWDLLKRQLAGPATAVVDVLVKVAGAVIGPDERKKLPLPEGMADRLYGAGFAVAPGKSLSGTFDLIRGLAGGRGQSEAEFQDKAAAAFRGSLVGTTDGRKDRITELGGLISEKERALSSRLTSEARSRIEGDRQALISEKKGLESGIKAAEEATQKAGEFRKSLEKFNQEFFAAQFQGFAYRDSAGKVKQGVRFTPVKGKKSEPDFSNLGIDAGLNALTNELSGFGTKRSFGAQSLSAANLTSDLEIQRSTARQNDLLAIQQMADYQARVVELLAGPGGEITALRQATEIRIAALEQEKAFRADIDEITREQKQLELDYSLRILEVQKQQKEQGRNTFTSLFDAGVAGGQGLKSFVTSTALSIPRTLAGNLGGIFGGLTGRYTLPGVTSGNLAGKLLAGTPFGVDPLKAAGDLQMTAAQIQLEAAQIQAGKGSGFTGAGGSLLSSLQGRLALAGYPGMSFSSGGGTVTDALGFEMPNIGSTGAYMPYAGPGGTVLSKVPKSYAGLAKGVGYAGAIAGGAFGAYSGFSAGGAQGFLTGTGSLAGSAGAILGLAGVSGPAAPILAGVGLALGVASMLMGDPKKRRGKNLQSEAQSRAYTEPTGADYMMDTYGRAIGYDYQGGTRPIIVNYNVTNNVDAVDGVSLQSMLTRNPDALSAGMSNAIMSGNAEDVLGAIRLASGG